LVNADVDYRVDIVSGSRVADIVIVSSARASQDGIDSRRATGRVFFDWKSTVGCRVDGELGRQIGDAFDHDCVEAVLPPDDAALQKAEEAGLLWPVLEGRSLSRSCLAEGMGAGANQPEAFALASINRPPLMRKLIRIFLEARSHARQDARALEDLKEVSVRVPLNYWCASPGGTGAGAMPAFIGEDGIIRSSAREAGVQARIAVQVVCRGSLEVKDNERVRLNESVTLRYPQAVASGGYVSPLTGRRHPPIDAIWLASNENKSGDLTSLDQLLVQRGHCDHFLYHTDAGARMRAALVDILDPQPDEYGDPRPGLTLECAFLSRDSGRLLAFCQNQATTMLIEAMRAPSDPQKARQEAADLARRLKIVESDDENLITTTLAHSSEPGEDVAERAKASFEDRSSGCRGLEDAAVAEEALRAVINSEIPQVHEPQIINRAHTQAEAVIAALASYQQQSLKDPDGLSRCQQVLTNLALVVRQSKESLAEKARELRELAQPHEQIVAEDAEQIGRWQQRRWPTHLANHFRIKGIARDLRESGASLISYTVQTSTCEIGDAEFLTPIAEHLENQNAWLSALDHKLIQISQICAAKARTAVAKPTIHTPRLGIELVTAEYADAYFDDFVRLHGGTERFSGHLVYRFLQKYGSLDALADAPLEECEEAFASIGAEVFEPQIDSEDVLTEFQRVHPAKTKQRRLISRLVKQSEGAMRTTGEGHEPITWVKTVNAPTAEAGEFLRQILPRVDRKEGPWDIAIGANKDRIDFGQARGRISLQSLIDRAGVSDDPSGWAQLIRHAPEPGIAVLVPPNPNRRQFLRVLVKAIANRQIAVGPKGSYLFDSSRGEPLDIGRNLPAVEACLQPKWRELVFAESTFGRNLVVAEEQAVSALEDLKAQIQSSDASNPLLQLIDLTAVEECLVQADLMLPRFRRMRKAIRKMVTS